MPLDDAYANAPYIPGAEAYPPRWLAAAAAFRDALGARAEIGVSYGASARQVFDFFNAEATARGTVVFVHGGYWKAFDHSSWSHLAAGPLAAGWSVAMPGYDLCPDVRIADITRQIAQAVTAIAARVEGPIVLTGHSAGGHLVARMLAEDVLPADLRARIPRVAPISPVADLLPLLQTSMNELFQLDEAAALAESPTHQPAPEADVKIWVGAEERPVFLEQAEALAWAWDAPAVVVPSKHHFDIIEALEDPQSDLVRFLTAS
ncbi:alpha/beta hydrolase [Roseobacter sinensis]|uniref:Alpha/beta fold hydrolase n=1 Tax=Roseobacter sinensis TaxID=2931391 RepID=A0ABT3BL00_9RHOB|nr:alpha/beta hydrolase [Roseobacter sp. WL0113]MCV3274247.1 alpha/beta fold hydrolase [Roseobacter sp. WL0113]